MLSNDESIFNALVEVSFTRLSLNSNIRYLREYIENKYFKKGKRKTVTLTLGLKPSFLNEFNRNNAYSELAKIEKQIQKLEPVHVYLPYELSAPEIDQLGKWFKKNVSRKTIIELHTDSALTIGAAFAYNGIYRDFSLKYFINNYRKEIIGLLDKYEKN